MQQLNKRSIRVEITKYNEKGNIDYQKIVTDNISVKFNFEKYIGSAMFGEGKVSICGLDKETTEMLTTINSTDLALKERKTIKIEAGYENTKKALIIDGSILSAVPTVPPNVWIDCIVLNGHERQMKTISVSVKGKMNIKELAETVALQIGLKNGAECRIKNEGNGKRFFQRKMNNLSYIGTAGEIITRLMNMYSFEEGDIYGVPVAYIDNETLIVDYSNFDMVESDKRVQHKINKETGMIGIPEISNAGILANITTLLKPEIKAGDVIDLESYMIPKANGKYTVIGTTYIGDYRGENWYSIFHCRRIYQ